MTKQKVVNIYAGPGVGKSTTAAGLFAALKIKGVNAELVTEFAKDGAWEKRSSLFFERQEYLLGEQSFRMERLRGKVDIIITDSPLLLTHVYASEELQEQCPSLLPLAEELYSSYDNLNIVLNRTAHYNPVGRNQTLDEAKQKDRRVLKVLDNLSCVDSYATLDILPDTVATIISILNNTCWIEG